MNTKWSALYISMILGLALIAQLIGAAAFPTNVHAASAITVTTIDDNTTSDTFCSLREAITNADNDTQIYADCVAGSGDDTIDFANALGTATITLTTTLPTIADTDGLTIDGSGDITLSGNNITQLFRVSTSVPLTLDGLTVANGYAIGDGGSINNAGTLTLNNSAVSANTATIRGGGIYNEGTLTLNASTVSGNSSGIVGGGIFNEFTGTLTLNNNSTVSGNIATYGGGIINYGSLTIQTHSVISSNSASFGGGLFTAGGSVSINNSTIGGASAGNTSTGAGGGGIYVDSGNIDSSTTCTS